MKNSRSDAERFARYQAVLDALLAKESFLKEEIHPSFKREDKAFIGRVITELFKDGYLSRNGAVTRSVDKRIKKIRT